MVGTYPIFIKYGSKGSQKSYLSVNKEAWGLTKFKKNKNEKTSSKPHPIKINKTIAIFTSNSATGLGRAYYLIDNQASPHTNISIINISSH